MPSVGHGLKQGEQPWRDVLLERHSVTAVEIPEHEHREFCLHLQLRGDSEMEWWSEGKNRVEATSPGSLILLAPGTRDRLRWGGSSDRLILSLRPELLQRRAEELGGSGAIEFSNRWSLRDGALEHVIAEMARESGEGWPLGSLYADLLGVTLSSLLLRRYASNPLAAPEEKGGLPFPKLRRAMEFITENLSSDLRLEQIASQIEISPFHFARLFRKSLGQSPYQYLLQQRIAIAKVLLRNPSLSVQEIAMQTGWNSPVNFVRAFRQWVGATPGAWRKSF